MDMDTVSKRKICFIMPNLSGGGAQRVVIALARYLLDSGYEVEILLTARNKKVVYSLDDRILLTGIYGRSMRKRIRKVREKMRLSRDTVYIAFLGDSINYTILGSLALNVKTIISIRNDPSRLFPEKTNLSKWLVYLASAVVFQTKDAQEQFSKWIKGKSYIIMNPLKEDLPSYVPVMREKRVVTACRLHEQKNLYMAIDAFSLFHKFHPDYKFEIYGEGELKNDLNNYVKQLGMCQYVSFKGFHENYHEFIIDSMMFLLSSNYEGMSNSLMEAMAIGLPVISTDCPSGGSRALIENGVNGILVPVGDYKKMAEAMCHIAEDNEYREQLARNAMKIRERCSIDKIGQEWESVFQHWFE